MKQIPAVMTPLDEHMGLDIARSLYKRNIPVYGLDHDSKAVGQYSRSCNMVLSPDPHKEPQEFVQYLIEFSGRLGCKPALFPLSDEHVLVISRNQEILKDHYFFVMPPKTVIDRLCTKAGLIQVAEEHDIPSPFTIFPQSLEEVERLATTLPYPVIIKPKESPQWQTSKLEKILRKGLLEGRAKVVVCHNAEELLSNFRSLFSITPELIIQEIIPGEDSRLYYASFYFDRDSKPLGYFAGQKMRVIPNGFGSASYAKSYYDPKLIDLGLKIFSATKYQGLGGIEFKKDPRDENYKLIEINTRFGMWDGLGAKCGVDLGYIAYCDIIGLPVERSFNYRTGVKWFDLQRDVRASIGYQNKGKLTWGKWFKSLSGEKMVAVYSFSDPLPGFFLTLELIRKLVSRFMSRLFKPSINH